MKKILAMIIYLFVGGLVGCAQPPQPPPLEIPGLQQYYQMPGPYYTAPLPQLQYYNPDSKKSVTDS